MRVVSPQYDLLYTVWCSHEHELYDMKVRHPLPPEIFRSRSLHLIIINSDLDRPLPD